MSLLHRAKDVASNPSHTQWLLPLLLVADAALCSLIINKVPCSFPSPLFSTTPLYISPFLWQKKKTPNESI